MRQETRGNVRENIADFIYRHVFAGINVAAG